MSHLDKYGCTITLKQLFYFVALAEHGSISSAANALNMAQPSLSEGIATLEKQLQLQLVVRGPRGVQMTEAGIALARHGSEISKSVELMIDDIRQIAGDPRGPVSVGFPPSLSMLLSVPLIETINNERPSIQLHIAEAMSGDILRWINSDRIDLGYVYDIAEVSAVISEPFLTEELFLVTAPDNWPGEFDDDGVALQPILASNIVNFPLVLSKQPPGAIKMQEKIKKTIGAPPIVIAELDSLQHIMEMVSRASAYTILSHGAVVNQIAAGNLAIVPIVEPKIFRTAYKVRRRDRPVKRAVMVVENYTNTILREVVSRHNLRAKLPDQADTEVIASSSAG